MSVAVEPYVSPGCLEWYEATRRAVLEACRSTGLCEGEEPPEGRACIELRARRGKKTLGILDLVLTRDGGAVIHWVYVPPKLRGRGLGTLLVRRAVELASRLGARYVQAVVVGEDEAELLGLDATPQAMRRILGKLGFKHAGGDVWVLSLE